MEWKHVAVRRLPDVLLLAGSILTSPLSRRLVRPLGDESDGALPGDDIVRDMKGQWTHGITIRGRPSDIWPWLVQMGCTRAGWYSYDGLDNGGQRSAERIILELQKVEVGDVFPWTPTNRDGFIVRAVEPERALVLSGTPAPYRMSWALVLEPIDETTTRLITRCRGAPANVGVDLLLRFVLRPIHFGMQRKQLLNIKRRVGAT